MRMKSALFYITTIWLSAKAIIVSVDRADYGPAQKHASMYVNDWRPVTGHDEINIKVSPTSKGQRFAAPLHPVIGKLQEHLESSDTSKSQNRNRPPDFAPPTILGSFSVFGRAAAKTREDPTLNIKLLPSETRKYSFLLPPNRDLFHSPDTQYISKTPKADIRDPSYYSSGPRYASTASPLVASRPFIYAYNVPKSLQPPDRPAAAFEYQNFNSQYLVPPGVDYAKDFEKNKSNQQTYNQNSNSQNFQPSNTDPSNYFNYINHPSAYKVTYERNPSYLIHESHQLGYVTPSFELKFKPSYQNYVMPPGVYTSTLPPRKINYLPPRPSNVNNESHSENVVKKLNNGPNNNEVHSKIRPQKYEQEFINNTQNSYVPELEPDFANMPPVTQQYFRQTITPIEQTTEKEYETPESISLKHYNDQLTRLAFQKNRHRFRDHEQTRQQEIQSQQYEEYSRQDEEQKYFDKQQWLKADNERTRNSEGNKPPFREEYQIEKIRSPQTTISSHRFPVDQGKTVELYQVTVSEQPTVSRHSTATHQPFLDYQTTQSPPKQKFESSYKYGNQNVQYPVESFNSTEIPVVQRQSQKSPGKGEPQIVSFYPESMTTETSIHSTEITESGIDIPVYTTILPEKMTAPPTERTRNHRPSGKRRRRPTSAVPRNTPLKINPESSERDNFGSDITRRNQSKSQQTKYEGPVGEHKPSSRRRPEVSVRVNKNELDIQTEKVNTNKFETLREEQVVYVTEYPTYYQKTPTESVEYVTETIRPSRINNNEYVTEPVRHTRINNYDYVTESSRPLRINNYEELRKTDYIESTTPVTLATSFTTTKEPPRLTTAFSTVSTTKPTNRVRSSRFGLNTSRPRFSVKEYKSRLDYKNRISQISTTEASIETSVKQRPILDHKKKPQSEPAVRETTGKYKYMSRVSYRTSSTTPVPQDQANTTFTTYTKNKINKFSPKQRPNNSYLYRSRSTSTTSNSIKEEGEGSPTMRPENVFSSSTRHRPTVMRNKLRSTKEPSETKDEIEMSIEETSFYSQPTSQLESIENQVNEILEEIKVTPSHNESNQEQEEILKIRENVSIHKEREPDSLKVKSAMTPINDTMPSTTKQSDEELFEKASQSVADLTSSASALYDKPGLFKAVSPSAENRIISTHLKITTGEPTLPIEAFFHNLSENV